MRSVNVVTCAVAHITMDIGTHAIANIVTHVGTRVVAKEPRENIVRSR